MWIGHKQQACASGGERILNFEFWILNCGTGATSRTNGTGERILNWAQAASLRQRGGIQLTSALKFPLEKGKYLVSIQGYKRKEELNSPNSNSGFLFSFTKVEDFENVNDPRDDDKYLFNEINKE